MTSTHPETSSDQMIVTSAFDQPPVQITIQKTQLQYTQLTHIPDLKNIPASTRRLKPLNDFLGQERAKAAVETGFRLTHSGYNIFAVGTAGLGKRTMLHRLLQQHIKQRPAPKDWVYVHNFNEPRQPIALCLPTGQAKKFQTQLHNTWHSIVKQLELRFSTQTYHAQIENIQQLLAEKQQEISKQLTVDAENLNLKLVNDQEGFQFLPLDSEKTDTDYKNIQIIEKKVKQLNREFNKTETECFAHIAQLNKNITEEIVSPRIHKILSKFTEVDGLKSYLDAYAKDLIENVEQVLAQNDDEFSPTHFSRLPARYQANVMVCHTNTHTAPIVFEDFPTHYNLLGHVEQLTQNGTISTDFTLIRSGALHRANGGFLILEAEQLLEQPYAWQVLKRVLKSGQIKLSSLEQMLTLTGNLSIEPEPIPLDVKVIILAEPDIYYEMLELEPELNRLFKIRADFTDTLQRTTENEHAYMQLVADYVHTYQLLPFDRTALAALLTDSSRQAEDQSALSLHASTLGDLVKEAHDHALQSSENTVRAEHIEKALNDRQYRLGYLRDLYWQDISKGTQLIETRGFRLGQINALSVIHYADVEFGLPSRLTASVYQGGGDILDIERSVELGGSLHAKGVLLMSSFLKAHFGREQILHFSAALAFEQSYAEVDGDSATVAELSALISAICQIPIDQSWAITGSMNQLGQVQPVGGVNAKIEGFFDACKLQGLTGKQGAIIPRQNMQHLMLRQDVVKAVEDSQFHIHAIDTIDQALELLMGHPVGTLDKKGRYTKNSIFAAVMEQLNYWQAIEDGALVEEEKSKKKKKKKAKKKKEKEQEAI